MLSPISTQSIRGMRNGFSVLLTTISNIRPGMTRQSLSRSFEEDGGLQFRSQGRYVYKHCQYIKIDVEFSVVSTMGRIRVLMTKSSRYRGLIWSTPVSD